MKATRTAFILMPFRQPFDSYYPAIFRPALEAAGFEVRRVDDLYAPRPIMLDIQEGIANSDLVLCEMTGRNPNVFYELGLAHAVGKPAVLVSSAEEDIPFDLRHVRVIQYEPRMAGWEAKLRSDIERAAVAVLSSHTVWPPALVQRSQSMESGLVTQAGLIKPDDSRTVARPVNLGFDGSIEGGYPHGWFNSEGHVSNVSLDYAVRVVPRDDGKPGRCVMMFKDAAEQSGFGSIMQRFPAAFLAGRTVRFEGEIRTEEVEGWAGFWLRADGDGQPDLFHDNMSGHRVTGTSDWTWHAVEAHLPAATTMVNLGVILRGTGVVWADNLRFSVWNPNGTWSDV
ncbi:MAG TPA: hypothetical protein VFA20_00800 [Myxococcaceae bacterium]|nr:hypothetical protein [Myxococcaceae bacterium]